MRRLDGLKIRSWLVPGTGLLAGLLLWSAPLPAGAVRAEDWAAVPRPSPGTPHVVGSPTAGCIGGARALPLDGVGYQAVRVSRNRYYGHPDLIHYLQSLGRSLDKAGMEAVYIGDLSQPRGGPTSYGHASHQSGLEADIWFSLDPKPTLPPEQREDIPTPSLVAPGGREVARGVWQDGHRHLLELAARPEEVDRIFVNAAIKRELCLTVTGDRSWLRKIRPWYHHDDHLHVRLKCPSGDPQCAPGIPLPADDGCGKSLSAWLTPATRRVANAPLKPSKRSKHPYPNLPQTCREILTGR
ncbi:MAG: penicillin-insensitive murein endopeptidase [Alphaproteobacteria bacterium]